MNGKMKYILADWFERSIPDYIPRKSYTTIFKEDMIFSLVGVRRAGKTFSFYQNINELQKTIPSKNILYLNFEDDRLYPMQGNELQILQDTYLQNFNQDSSFPIYLFLDEIQNIKNWERTVRRIYDTKQNVKIAITGSSSKLLSSEIASSLRGRTISKIIYPLSFNEFLGFKNFKVKNDELSNIEYSPQKNKMLKFFNEYMENGGFPKVVLAEHKIEILREYYKAIFFRDIIERNEIRNIKLFENFMKLVTQSISNRFSYGKAKNTLNSIGFKVSKTTLIEYLTMMESALFIHEVHVFSYTVKDQLQYPRKIYIIDNGLRNAVCFRFSDDLGLLLENLVFLALLQKEEEIFYWQDNNGHEVDFLIRNMNKVVKLIQVCYDVSDSKTRKREERALYKAMDMFNLKTGLILTYDYSDKSDKTECREKQIEYKPVWKWMLEI
ncbi:MAG: ATP-binding protein [Candidatus Cloacimonetes bacterium]|nr:ATP-binding protein [Candidatus Cloacimonadota bacterium]